MSRPYVIDRMISAKAIDARIEELAREIAAAFAGTDKLVLVGLLRGSFVFIADLVRELELPVEIDFLEVSSYGDAMESSREVRILKDLRGAIEGRDVLVVDDIYDIGLTLEMIEDYCHSRHARSVNSAVLVRKIHDRPTTGKLPRFIGLDVEDKYIFGCGMDAYEHWRHLDEIRALEDEE